MKKWIPALIMLFVGVVLFFAFQCHRKTTTDFKLENQGQPRKSDFLQYQRDSVFALSPNPMPYKPTDFKTYRGFRDYWRTPLVYPYSLCSIDSPSSAMICDERKVKKVESNGQKEQFYHGFTHFCFNQKCLAGLSDNIKGEFDFFVFHFGTNESESFEKKELWIQRCYELGLDGTNLISTRNYYNWF